MVGKLTERFAKGISRPVTPAQDKFARGTERMVNAFIGFDKKKRKR